jgi:hypothetical protein
VIPSSSFAFPYSYRSHSHPYPLTPFLFQWYCCRDPQLFDLPNRQRNLRNGSNSTFEDQIAMTEQSQDDIPPVDSKVVYLQGKKILLRPENFEEDEEDDDTYFERIHSDFKRRNLQSVVYEEDYEDVPYWPYEWLLKVDTEVSRGHFHSHSFARPRIPTHHPSSSSTTVLLSVRRYTSRSSMLGDCALASNERSYPGSQSTDCRAQSAARFPN